MIGRQVPGTFARANHLEARGARPIHLLSDQGRLISVCQAVDDAGLRRLARQQWAGQGVRLDVDHHDVAPISAAQPHVPDARGRIAGGIHHQFQPVSGDERLGVLGDRDGRRIAAYLLDGCAGPRGGQIGDARQQQSGRTQRLREKHAAELAHPNQPDTHGIAEGGAPAEVSGKVHGRLPRGPWLSQISRRGVW